MPFAPRPLRSWSLRTRTLALGERTLLMAIVNLTPDSFSGDGLIERGVDAAVQAACACVEGGADIVDLGAESTRPGAQPLSAPEEQKRLLPVLTGLLRAWPKAIVSVDTYHAATARAAAAAGAEIINDVSGLVWEQAMASTVAESGCGLVLMHTRGRPDQWRTLPPQGRPAMLEEVLSGLQQRLALAEAAGLRREHMVIDPGFGFGKLGRLNFDLLAELGSLQQFGCGVLAGLSRKGFLGEAVRHLQPAAMPPAAARRDATLAGNVAAVLAGAHVLRVHDLQAAREAAAIADAVLAASP